MSKLTLYDLHSIDGQGSWLLFALKVRLVLAYKGIQYTTKFLEYPDVEPTLRAIGTTPQDTNPHRLLFTLPTVQFADGTIVYDSDEIIKKLESDPQFKDHPSLLLDDPTAAEAAAAWWKWGNGCIPKLMGRMIRIVTPRSREYFSRTREWQVGMPMEEFEKSKTDEQAWIDGEPGVKLFSELLNRNEGPFILGDKVSYGDFFIVSAWEFARRVNPELFERLMKQDPAFPKLYGACEKWLNWKRD